MKNLLFVLLMASLLWACKNGAVPKQDDASTTEKTTVTQKPKNFGKVITPEGAMTMDELLAQMESKDSILNIKVMGKVQEVCQKKGCWMNVADSKGEKDIFVQFKDYGFFMPKDLTGSTVAMTGKAYIDVTSVDELRHYAKDEGKSKEEIDAITEPEKQLKFLADGVVIVE